MIRWRGAITRSVYRPKLNLKLIIIYIVPPHLVSGWAGVRTIFGEVCDIVKKLSFISVCLSLH